ncbi:cellulose synthase [Brenneria goodwinii]|uniref:cellulose biosynthesis protein BcsD n=1 Tax=Brenneria goodwinii TaxID=1109412 RepID=UPI000EF1C303|nr:cellulose biosynthesis protein BcsD [Brenneria goodwinii]MCG8155630.1 cellulose synthase [Brenneria goodwinii]MCG8160343.1 cellulose synthase [Brenneria goodwinii]MCG8164866.1 cellulose synthase [Brenneria goodwinii]MCG8169477.1 cellulose synthase [Brenneria goodwinii]MCG8174651.1 cellulose synthase [Brenneria goodwinii]
MQAYDPVAQQLEYYQYKQQKPGWQDLLQVLFAGIFSDADEADASAFLRLAGKHFARRYPLAASLTLGELEDRINQRLAEFDWGFVRLEPAEQALTLLHQAWPMLLSSEAPHNEERSWRRAFSCVLEGVYSEWLQSQGGHPHIAVRGQSANVSERTLIFLYKGGL